MDTLQAVVLACVQGITEFLPVSSSGHLILLPKLLGWRDQGLAFDVAVHLGTLMAVVLYFWASVSQIIIDTWKNLFGRQSTQHSQLGWQVVIATIPVGLVGLAFGDMIETQLRNPLFIGLVMLIFAPLLWWIDKNNAQHKGLTDLSIQLVLIIGLAQAIALMPGVSRSGMTIIAALYLGFSRDAAARFSFLMSIPVIILAGGLKAVDLAQSDIAIPWGALLIGITVSFLVALACIHWFLEFIRRYSMAPFSIYLFILGGLILLTFS